MAGETVVTSLAFPEMAWLGSSAHAMARRMTQAVQSHLIDKGRYLEAVQISDPPAFERHEFDVDLPGGSDPLLHPPRRCRHVAFLSSGPANTPCIGYVPALGIVALAEAERLRDAVSEAIVLEHRRTGRQTDVRRQVAAQWFEQVELTQLPLDVVFHSAEALRKLKDDRAKPLLPTVADKMSVGSRPAIGLAEPLTALKRAAEGRFARSVLIVGTESSGKTALIHQYARERRDRAGGSPWETSAARLIQGLTRDGSWQQALTTLCRELAAREVVLYVGHLAELFEVGQYQGNSVSLGDALREPLARGQLMLLAEATPAELSQIDLRSPGFSALFQTVRLPELPEAEQERTMLAAVAALAAEHRVAVSPDAVSELIALQRRFSPYSGFPGKGIRFFEELILHVRGQQGAAIGRDDALAAFCAETGMPRRMLDARLPLSLDEVDGFFRSRLFGQPEALSVVTNLLVATKAGLARGGKPIASMLLIGPTGVGKTETAKALAEFMFGDPRRMIRIDMSEYADPAAVLRLLGDLGGDEGVLIGAVRRQPFSVVLFDELEKAHPSFFDLLLQVLGEGRLTGGDGLTANFCGSFVVMTSNLGAEAMQRTPMGLGAVRGDPRTHFEQAVQQALRPELFNRIDHIVPFAALSAAERAPIFGREMTLLRKREGLLERSAEMTLDDGVADRLAALPGDERYGARDVQRVLRRQLLMPLAHALSPHAYVTPLAVRIGAGDAGQPLGVRVDPLQRPIDNAPLLTAEALADARRHWQRVTEGPLFVNLVNQVFRLDDERRRYENKRKRAPHLPHWDGTPSASRARTLSAVQQTAQGLFAEITALEGQALLALVGESDAPPNIAAWRARFTAFKQQAFHAVRPDSGVCTVGLYAAPALATMLHDAWCELAALAGFEFRSQVVRLGDEPRKPAPPADTEARDEKREEKTDEEAPPSPYLKFPWPQASGRKSLIVGFEIELKGPAVFDYFRQESGVWRIWVADRNKSDAWVSVRSGTLSGFETPHNVHRQHFFDSRPVHRVLREGVLASQQTDWKTSFPDAPAWKHALDAQFDVLMDSMLLGEDD